MTMCVVRPMNTHNPILVLVAPTFRWASDRF
jgi:hypothetical protein